MLDLGYGAVWCVAARRPTTDAVLDRAFRLLDAFRGAPQNLTLDELTAGRRRLHPSTTAALG
jgi:hypothetical protein